MLRQIEPMTTEIFVMRAFQEKSILRIISKWRVEPSEVQAIIVRELKEIGIYMTQPFQESLILRTIITILKNDNEILALVKNAEYEEMKRNQSRHASL